MLGYENSVDRRKICLARFGQGISCLADKVAKADHTVLSMTVVSKTQESCHSVGHWRGHVPADGAPCGGSFTALKHERDNR